MPHGRQEELSPNNLAFPFVMKLLSESELLRVKAHNQKGTTVIDCGVQVQGSIEAGILFASVCLGGLARVQYHWAEFNGLRWPAVEVTTDHPIRACLASQYAGWPIQNGKIIAMGSGPGRSVVHEGALFNRFNCEDHSDTVIICLESEALPDEMAVEYILEECQCPPTNLYVLVAPTVSQVGSVQIAARALETGLAKLMELGYDLRKIVSGWGICPLSPLAGDNFKALGRTNDAILYGSTVMYNVQDDDSVLQKLIKQVPSCASQEYGRYFEDLYRECGDFYAIDPLFFSPAEVWLCNLRSGNSYYGGALRSDLLRLSFGIK